MKTLTVRLPEAMVAEIEVESRGRRCSKSDIVRERLQRAAPPTRHKSTLLETIADLIGPGPYLAGFGFGAVPVVAGWVTV